MNQKQSTKQGRAEDKAADEELTVFAHHLAEPLRIARTRPTVPSRFYNDLADAWCEFENAVPHSSYLRESEEMILLTLQYNRREEAAREGGAE